MRFANFSVYAIFAAAVLALAIPDRAVASAGFTGCPAFNGSISHADHVIVMGDGFTSADRITITATVVSQASTTPGNYELTVSYGGTQTRSVYVAAGATVTLGPISLVGAAGLTLTAKADETVSAATPAAVTLTYSCAPNTSSSINAFQAAATPVVATATATANMGMVSKRISMAVQADVSTLSANVATSNLGGPGREESLQAARKGLLLWTDARITGADDDSNDGYHFTQLNTLSGADYRLTDTLLIGAFVGFETAQSELGSADMDSHGISIGTYLGWRVRPNLVLDLAAFKTFADYDISTPDTSAKFDGNRTTYLAGLTGSHEVRGVTMEPSVNFTWVDEDQGSYEDSAEISHEERTVQTGRVASGGRLMKVLSLNSTLQWQPYAGLYADYYFSNDKAALSSDPVAALSEGWSARATAGAEFTAGPDSPWQISLGAELGNIGSGTALIPSGHAGAALRF